MPIDTHAHLLHSRYHTENPALTPAEVVHASALVGVHTIINIATTRAEWPAATQLADSHPGKVFTSIGLHPEYAGEVPPVTKDELLPFLSHPSTVAVGETGLDYYYTAHSKTQQIADFHTHMQAAEEARLPAVIHTREAEADTLHILAQYPNVPFVLHCFTGSQQLAEEAVALGGYISFSGILTFKKAQNLRDIAAILPANRILVETDAPYLAPEPFRGKRAIPGHVVETLRVLAAARQQSVEEVDAQTTQNACTLFPKLARQA